MAEVKDSAHWMQYMHHRSKVLALRKEAESLRETFYNKKLAEVKSTTPHKEDVWTLEFFNHLVDLDAANGQDWTCAWCARTNNPVLIKKCQGCDHERFPRNFTDIFQAKMDMFHTRVLMSEAEKARFDHNFNMSFPWGNVAEPRLGLKARPYKGSQKKRKKAAAAAAAL